MEEAQIKIAIDAKQAEYNLANLSQKLKNMDKTIEKSKITTNSFGAEFKEVFETAASQAGILDERLAGGVFEALNGLAGRMAVLGTGAVVAGLAIYSTLTSMAKGSEEFSDKLDKIANHNFGRMTISQMEGIHKESQKLLEDAQKNGSWLDWFFFGKDGPDSQVAKAKANLDAVEKMMQDKRTSEAQFSARQSKLAAGSEDDVKMGKKEKIDKDTSEKIDEIEKLTPGASKSSVVELDKKIKDAAAVYAKLDKMSAEMRRKYSDYAGNTKENSGIATGWTGNQLEAAKDKTNAEIEVMKKQKEAAKEVAAIREQSAQKIKAVEAEGKGIAIDRQRYLQHETEAFLKKEAAEKKKQDDLMGKHLADEAKRAYEGMKDHAQELQKAEKENQAGKKKELEEENQKRIAAAKEEKRIEEEISKLKEAILDKEEKLSKDKRAAGQSSLSEVANDRFNGQVGFDARQVEADEKRAKRANSSIDRTMYLNRAEDRRLKMAGGTSDQVMEMRKLENDALKEGDDTKRTDMLKKAAKMRAYMMKKGQNGNDIINPKDLDPFGDATKELKDMNNTLLKIEKKVNTAN